MEVQLRDLLRIVSSETSNVNYTHITAYGPQGKWLIKPQAHDKFWVGYCQLVEKINQDPFIKLCLAEKPTEMMPIIERFTFKFQTSDDDDNWEPFEEDFLVWLTYIYQSVINDTLKLTSETHLELLAVVMESITHWFEENENGNKLLIIEVMLQFPYARIDTGYHRKVIRPKVLTLLRNHNVISKLNRQPIGDWEQIISTPEMPFLYGSNDREGKSALEVKHIWEEIAPEMLEENIIPNDIDVADAFVIANHTHIQQKSLTLDAISFNRDNKFWYPLLLSIHYWQTILLPKENQPEPLQSSNPIQREHRQYKQDETLIEIAEKLLSLVNPNRFLRESCWNDIGKALFTCDEGGENGLRAWIRHTERALQGVSLVPAFMKIDGNLNETCKNKYNMFANSSITLKTLAWYAKEDNPDRYNSWHYDWCYPTMVKALSCLHTDVAECFYRFYWLEYVFCPIGAKGKWFKFRNHRWTETAQALDLKKNISSDFMKKFERMRATLSQEIALSDDENFKTNAELNIKKITALIAKLKTVSFKNSLMTEACEYYNCENFMNLLDNNSYLTGVLNGVLEIMGNTILFRAGKPEDYISMNTNVPYNNYYSFNDPLVKECWKWIKQVFPYKDLRHYFMKFASSCLQGKNSDKLFPIWTGEGDNSKSMIVKLFEATFNNYCIKLPVTMLSEKAGNSSGPSPQLARAKSTRVAFLDEPEDDIPLHKGIIKRFTGGDSFFARLLQDNGGDIQMTFKMILMCNKIPIIANSDKAVKNRTRIFPFLSTWVDNPPETEQEQKKLRKFKKDVNFEKRIPIMAPAFLWLMAHFFPYYAEEKLVSPPSVIEHTEKYWMENDLYAHFCNEMIQEVVNEYGEKDKSSKLTLTEIYSEFKSWYREALPGSKIPERSIVKNELSMRWGKMVGNAWVGITLKTDSYSVDMTSDLLGGMKKRPSPKLVIKPDVGKQEV